MSEQETPNQSNPSEKTEAAAQTPYTAPYLDGKETSDSKTSFEMIMDIPVTISMEVGRANLSIRKILQLTQGSVIELERLAGEPLDVMVNGTLIAHGEVVVVNEKFGIRLTDIMSQAERIQKLQ